MDQPYLRAFENLCTQEEPPACQTTCPLHVESRTFVELMAAGKIGNARKILDRTMPLPMLTGFLCEGNCLKHCLRHPIDAAVQLPLLERACLLHSRTGKPFPLPGTGKKVAVFGSDLSSLCATAELAQRGHKTTIFYYPPFGSSLTEIARDVLPETALPEAREYLESLRVDCVALQNPFWAESFGSRFNAVPWVNEMLDAYDALYLGLDDSDTFPADSPLHWAYACSNPLTLETDKSRFFCYDTVHLGKIQAAAQGKRVAGSITRLLQGVPPASAREKDGVYPTKLYTSTAGVVATPPAVPANAALPTLEEAAAEASRCIQCECLECVKVCPYLAQYKGYPKKYAREMYNNLSVIHGLRQKNQQINSCTRCGLCATVCPTKADMGAFCATARQEMVQTNRMPPHAHEFALEDMGHSNSPDIAFARHQPGFSSSDWLFFPGCQLPASLPQQTRQVYQHLCTHLQGGTGFLLRCCGTPAQWSGRDVLTKTSTEALLAVLEEMGRPTLIVACASCSEFIAKNLPAYPCRTLWDVLQTLPMPNTALAGVDGVLALHDPCATRHCPETHTAVRELVKALGIGVEALPFSASHTRCCGYGGLAAAANPGIGEVYARTRAEDSAQPMLTYCAMCRDRLATVGKQALHLLELLFPAGPVQEAMNRPAPGISQRQYSRNLFRQEMLNDVWEDAVQLPENPANTFACSPELETVLEERRIRHADIAVVLAHAKEHGPLFSSPQTGRCLVALRPRQVTFWVEYQVQGDGSFFVHNAYCHRMVVPGVDGAGEQSPATLEGYATKGGRQ